MRTATKIITQPNSNTSTLAGNSAARYNPTGEVIEPTNAISAAAL